MREGDIILELGGMQVNKVAAIQAYLSERSPGETLKVKVLRGNQEIVLEVTLDEARS
jgi:S1-C subfamily serine protease